VDSEVINDLNATQKNYLLFKKSYMIRYYIYYTANTSHDTSVTVTEHIDDVTFSEISPYGGEFDGKVSGT